MIIHFARLEILTRSRHVESKLPAQARPFPDVSISGFRSAGLPIGSGVMEAACKELVKARFGRSGMRRKRDTGSPILQPRAIKLSKQWDSFGPVYMLQAT
jgi:hypothetical protein